MQLPRLLTAPSSAQHQRGSTVLGLIIGVLIGLFVALALAIWVTKVPIPFAPRSYHSGSSAEQERERNKDWQPNAPLSGKVIDLSENTVKVPTAAPADEDEERPASIWQQLEDATPTPRPTSDPAQATPTPRPTATPTATAQPTAKPTEADPLAQLLQSKQDKAKAPAALAPAVPSSNTAAPAFTYYVQIGAFSKLQDAEALRAQSALSGLAAHISEAEQGGRTIHRVRLGPFDSKDAADDAQARMQNSGVQGVLIRLHR